MGILVLCNENKKSREFKVKLAQLLSIYKHFKLGDEPLREVTGLCIDSRQVQSGQVFVAIRGQSRA